MKTIQTSLNEQEYKQFRRKADLKEMTDYAFLKSLVLRALSNV